jgi:uncharacterized protein YggE
MPLALRALPLVALLAAGTAAGQERAAPASPPPAEPRTIRVGGQGRASVAPDVAVLTLGIEAIGKRLSPARAEADTRMREILAAVKAAGVRPEDVQTVRYDVQVERSWKDGQPGPVTGYRVSNLARVKVRDLARVGEVVDRAAAAGANAVQGLAFEREDAAAEEGRALAAATRAARAKAEALARAAGVALGKLLSVAESVQASPPIPMRMESLARAAGAPVEAGEIEVRAAVELVFAME